jgi:hypothetical protein
MIFLSVPPESSPRFPCKANIQTPLMASKHRFFPQSFFLCLLCFCITFFFPNKLTSHHGRQALYEMTLNDELKVTLCFSPSRSSLPYHYNNSFHIIAHFLIFRSNRIATDVAFLPPERDGCMLTLGIRL